MSEIGRFFVIFVNFALFNYFCKQRRHLDQNRDEQDVHAPSFGERQSQGQEIAPPEENKKSSDSHRAMGISAHWGGG